VSAKEEELVAVSKEEASRDKVEDVWVAQGG
jgi:hypothetical protein